MPKRIPPQRQVKTPRNSAEATLAAVTAGTSGTGENNDSHGATQSTGGGNAPRATKNRLAIRTAGPFSHEWSPGTLHLGKDYKDILRQGQSAISTFLQATSGPDNLSDQEASEDLLNKTGARSLFETTLAQVSKNMVDQQKQIDKKNDGYNGQHDFIGSRLQELEEYFGDSTRGWPLLRQVVRNCGIYMITRLLKTGALLDSAAVHLASHCRYDDFTGTFEAAMWDMMIETHTHNLDEDVSFHQLPYPDDLYELSDEQSEGKKLEFAMSVQWTLRAVREANDPLVVLERFVRYGQLCFLIMVKSAADDTWEARRDTDALLEAIYTASLTRSAEADPRVLLRKVSAGSRLWHDNRSKSTSSHVMSETLFNRLKSPLGLLLYKCQAAQYQPLIERISKSAQASVELDLYSELSEYQQYLAAIMFFANVCQRLSNGCEVTQDLLGSLNIVLTERCASAASDAFVTTVLALKHDTEGFKQLIPQLLTLDCGHYRHLGRLIAEICAAAAMDHAAANDTDRDVVQWAVGVVDAVTAELQQRSSVDGSHTPSTKPLQHYQWEDDVAEWIAKTPVIRHLIQGGDGKDERSSIVCQSRQPLGSIPANAATVPTGGPKRKSLACGMETHSDGDFVYKKPKRNLTLDDGVDHSNSKTTRTVLRHLDDESEDELSMLE